jgi:hypothetical protein
MVRLGLIGFLFAVACSLDPERGVHPKSGVLVVSFSDAEQPDFPLTAKLPVEQFETSPAPLPVRDYGDGDVVGTLAAVGAGCAELYDPQHTHSLMVLPDCGCLIQHHRSKDNRHITPRAVIVAQAPVGSPQSECTLDQQFAEQNTVLLLRIRDSDDAAQLLLRMKMQASGANAGATPLSGTIFSRNEQWESMLAANLLDRLPSSSTTSNIVPNSAAPCKNGVCERPKVVLILSIWSTRMAQITLKYIQRSLDDGTIDHCILHNAHAGSHGAGAVQTFIHTFIASVAGGQTQNQDQVQQDGVGVKGAKGAKGGVADVKATKAGAKGAGMGQFSSSELRHITRGHGLQGRVFALCNEASTLYVLLNDNVVYIGEGAIEAMVQQKLQAVPQSDASDSNDASASAGARATAPPLFVSANLVNHPSLSHVHQTKGALRDWVGGLQV